MKRRPSTALVVYCHPDPDSFSAHLRDRTLAGLRAAGYEIDLIDLYGEGFEPTLRRDEWSAHRTTEISADVADHCRRLASADALVLVYPTWWSGQPAMLKGWFDRVWVDGVAYDLAPGARRITSRLRKIRSITVVTTHGSARYLNIIEGQSGRRFVGRQLRALCSWRMRVHWVALYDIDRATAADRTAFAADVERRLARL